MVNSRVITALIFLAALFCGEACATEYSDVKKGNKDYNKGQYTQAVEQYDKAHKKKPLWEIPLFNLGNAFYRLEKYDDAVKKYSGNNKTKDTSLLAETQYNMGNAYFKKNDYEKAVESYKNALRIKPDDADAKFNLELALKKQQEKQNKDKDNKDKDKQNKNDKDKKDQNKDKDKNKQGKDKDKDKDKDKGKDKDKDKDKDNGQKQEKEEMPEKGEISKNQADKILNAFQKQEDKNRKNIKSKSQVIINSEKDW